MFNYEKEEENFYKYIASHRILVQKLLYMAIDKMELEGYKKELYYRLKNHDNDKLLPENRKEIIKFSYEINKYEYGTKEYFDTINKYSNIINKHYILNSHHPEHYKNGYGDMSIIDKIEMICDWVACIINKNDNFDSNINKNNDRFDIPNKDIMKIINTASYLYYNYLSNDYILNKNNLFNTKEDFIK